jgi:two-component system sensor histidine kinase KdpD
MAHELRGPLTALVTSSELLAEDFELLDPDQVRGMLSAMHRRTLWLQGLVENMLAAATIREGGLRLHVQALDLLDVIGEAQGLVEPLLAQKEQPLHVHVQGRLPSLSGDARRLGQVLVNLILNASKFSDAQLPIDVTVRGSAKGVRVTVEDRGPGLPTDGVERLFEPYYQASPGGRRQEGVGLGLSIVRSIIEAHGGEVSAEPREGGGARFWFELRARNPELRTPERFAR